MQSGNRKFEVNKVRELTGHIVLLVVVREGNACNGVPQSLGRFPPGLRGLILPVVSLVGVLVKEVHLLIQIQIPAGTSITVSTVLYTLSSLVSRHLKIN